MRTLEAVWDKIEDRGIEEYHFDEFLKKNDLQHVIPPIGLSDIVDDMVTRKSGVLYLVPNSSHIKPVLLNEDSFEVLLPYMNKKNLKRIAINNVALEFKKDIDFKGIEILCGGTVTIYTKGKVKVRRLGLFNISIFKITPQILFYGGRLEMDHCNMGDFKRMYSETVDSLPMLKGCHTQNMSDIEVGDYPDLFAALDKLYKKTNKPTTDVIPLINNYLRGWTWSKSLMVGLGDDNADLYGATAHKGAPVSTIRLKNYSKINQKLFGDAYIYKMKK